VSAPGGEAEAVDFGRLIAEIEEEARRLRREGVVSAGYERELDAIFTRLAPPAAAEDFDAALASAEELAHIDPHAPVLSNKPAGSAMKKTVRKLVFFYGAYLTDQVTQFSTTIARTTRLLGRRVDALEAALPSVSPTVRAIVASLDPGPEGVEFASALRERLPAASGRVVVGECGRGDLLRPLVDGGIDAYGVEPRTRLADAAGAGNLEVREDAVLDHLRLVPTHALAGVVLVGCVDRVPVGTRIELLQEAARALEPGGTLGVIVGSGPSGQPGARALADLLGERPLHADTWRVLLEAEGFESVDVVDAALVVGRRSAR
jgi:SAM-dependent methyltransferase